MSLRLSRAAVLALALGICLAANLGIATSARADEACRYCGGSHAAGARCLPREVSRPDLFYNFYTGAACDGVPVEMYPAPYPTPPIVGHVYYTYQPLMPHEMLYRHHRVYRQYYNYGRGMNRTTVRWW